MPVVEVLVGGPIRFWGKLEKGRVPGQKGVRSVGDQQVWITASRESHEFADFDKFSNDGHFDESLKMHSANY